MHRIPKLLATIFQSDYALVKDAISQLGPDANNKIIAGLATDALINTDYIPYRNTVNNVLKRISWLNVKLILKAYFDTIYTPITPLTGEKITGTDAGTFGQFSITDDYLYLCVQTGTTSTAIWKKLVLFQSI